MTALEIVEDVILRPAVIVVLAAVIAACAGRASAAARHSVWLGALGAILLLPAAGLVLPEVRLPLFPAPEARATESIATGAATSSGRVARTTLGPWWDEAVMRHREHGATGNAGRLLDVIAVSWLIGVLAFGTRRIVAAARVHRLVARSRPTTDARLHRLLRIVAARSGSRANPAILRISEEMAAPATAGLLRAVILLPATAMNASEDELSAILAHELGHVARRDCVINLLADLTAILYWCNPLVALAVQRLKSESERDCDDRALRSGAEPRAYARLLLSVARSGELGRAVPESVITLSRRRQLEPRLHAVLDPRISRRPLAPWKLSSLVAGVMICMLPAAALSMGVARTPASRIAGPEPDRAGDALAKPDSEQLPESSAPIDTALVLSGPDSTLARRLIAASRHVPDGPSDLVRDRAAWALSQARDGRLVESLLAALDAHDWRVRAYAAWALAGTTDPRAIPRLCALLQHPVWRLRAMAAFAIRVSEDPRAAAAMTAALVDPAWQVRVEAVEYFGAVGGPARAERIEPRLADRHVAVRVAAERALTH